MMKRGVTLALVLLLSLPVVLAFPSDYISHWSFDGNSVDSAGNYNGQENMVSYAHGFKNDALILNGSGFIDFGDIPELNNAEAFTLLAWFNQTDNLAEERLFDKSADGSHDFSVAPYDGKIYIEIGDGANTYAYWNGYSALNPSGTWNHLAVVFDGTEATNAGRLKLYINGVQQTLVFVGTIPAHTSAEISTAHFTASIVGAEAFHGMLDETYLYSRALKGDEVREVYNNILCGNGLINSGEQCDDGNLNNYDECSNACEYGLREFDISTCQGDAELYAYHGTPMQTLEKEFVTSRDELYVMTRGDYLSDVNVFLDGILAPKATVIDTPAPFAVKVYKVNTTPGDVVRIADHSIHDSRAIQGFLTQDSAHRAVDINSSNVVLDDFISNKLDLVGGTYDFVIFDKYTRDPPGYDPDNRRLTVKLRDPLTNSLLFNKNYTDPFPGDVEGVVVDSYTIPSMVVPSTKRYEFVVDSEDSVYWFMQSCSKPPVVCPDADRDGVCDRDDDCPGSKPGEPVDQNGCDPFQFCGQFYCGFDCFSADFMGNEPNVTMPNDCTVVLLNVEGMQYPACRPTEVNNMCFG